MAETIESFVAKLQAEGVQTGQEAAEKLRAEARRQAEEIINQAEARAEKIVADARTEAEKILARSKTELALAARDAALRLHEAMGRALQAVIARGVKAKLTDSEFIGKTLHELIMLYAKAELESGSIEINVSPQIREQLTKWALHEIALEATDSAHLSIDLKGKLAEAGFEYNVASGATVEVTLDSVVQALMELVGPGLREVLSAAMAGNRT